MARNTKRLFRAFTTKSSRGEKWRKSTTHSVTRVARVPHGPGAPKLIKWRFSSAHRRRFGSFPHVTTNTTGQLAVHMEGHGEEGGGTPGRKVEGPRGGRWSDSGEEGGGTPGCKVEGPRGGRWRNSGEEGGGTQGCKVEGPRGARWRNPGEEGGGTQGCKVEEPRGGRWRNPGVQGGGTQGCKVEEPRGARWRNPGVQGGGQREHHETARETQWGDFCKAVRELACCSALRRWVTKNTRRESEAHAWEDAAVRHRRVAEVFGEVHASTRKRNVTLAAAGPDRWSW